MDIFNAFTNGFLSTITDVGNHVYVRVCTRQMDLEHLTFHLLLFVMQMNTFNSVEDSKFLQIHKFDHEIICHVSWEFSPFSLA